MNKFLKSIIAVLGAIDVVFSIFIPIAVALLLIRFVELSNFNAGIVIVLGLLSAVYRGIKFWIE